MAITTSMPTVGVAPLTSTARAAVPARGFLGGTVGVVETREVSVRVAAPTQYFYNGAAARVVETREINLVSTMPTTCDVGPVDFWREVHGANDWEYLVQPLHPLLRREIVRYGEFVAACYKAFDLDPNSKRYLTCKYGKRNMLKEAGMGDSGYDVTKYIYVTPDVSIIEGNPRSRWMGYVAVSSDETANKLGRRDVLICLRGTVTTPEWIANLMGFLTPVRLDPHDPKPDVRVETGFLSLYTSDEGGTKFGLPSCREQLLSEVSRLVKKHKGEELSITIVGHSMGSSLGALLAYDITELGLNKTDPGPDGDIPVTVFSFGGPRVGNAGFKKRLEELGVKILRIANVNDPVTKMPGVVFNENTRVLGGMYELPWSGACYAHLGVEVVLDFFNEENPTCVHDIEGYVTLLKCQGKSFDDEITMDGDEFLLNVLSFLQNPGAIW